MNTALLGAMQTALLKHDVLLPTLLPPGTFATPAGTPSGPVLCKTGFCDFQDGDTAGPNQSDDPTRGKCTQICASDDDCGSGTTCQDFPYGPGRADSVKICK